uniref:Uncharacterized protein n=1 Tax=viral metagenome TaxID=1070528 RepID=A0A6H1ZDQ2_9ZZZZ
MKKLLIATIIFITLLVILFIWGANQYDKQLDPLDVYGAECPPQTITAQSVKANVVDYTGQRFETMTKIKLPKSIEEVEIDGKVFKKEKYNPDNFILEEEIFKQKK